MNVVLLSDVITLEQKLEDVLRHQNDLRIEQSSHLTFRLEKRHWFVFWKQIAWMDIYYNAIRIRVREWRRHEAIVAQLARVIEKYASVREIVIEVQYPKLEEE